MAYLNQALVFLVDTLLGAYLVLVLLRLVLQMTRADFYNPFAQFLVRATNPAVLPLRRIIPGFRGIDWASVLVLTLLMLAKVALDLWLAGQSLSAAALAVLTLANLFQLVVYVFLVAVFIRAALSWINPYGQHPVGDLLENLTEPLLFPARKLVPPVGGFDLSPLLVVVILELTLILMVHPLLAYGYSLLGA